MLVRYGDGELERLVSDGEARSSTYDDDLVRSCRRRHQALVAAKDRQDLQALRSLDLQSEDGPGGAHVSIRLIGGTRLLLDLNEEKTDEVTVLGIVESDTREVAP
ncbi:type II toxin-antitoxin system RelE/ParE family toxin [Amycolatopsis thermoflava]|uniref:Plasmid maintenance system killer protein n=1 Tax=Amycolatopsis thermoflava TaxID=84480 RepID=A0A3N2GPF0_9PSEU|nr:type II toxin-antitoxin system RelE/ParE family toxin [Amycolatopsis thermoflava]ROS38497.1 plasmid maintenance system killer protein [Amycolatopsis thermoflava]